jgi:hypothetical protein
LTEQVPALVELGLDPTQPGVFVVGADLAIDQLAPQFALLGDEF